MPLSAHRRWLLVLTIAAAVSVFAVVQDRVTAAAARQYVAVQRERMAAGAPPVDVDEVMRPAIRRSVLQGALSGSAVLVAGLALSALSSRSGARA